jgi:hypothetical protein
LVFLFAVAGVQGAHAEVIGPLLPKATFEAGLQYRQIEREVYSTSSEQDIEQTDVALIGRWGFTELATLSFELSRGSGDMVGGFEGTQMAYLIGTGIQAAIFRSDNIRATIAYQVTMTLNRADEYPANVSTESHGGQLTLEGNFRLWGDDFYWFAGPAYSIYYYVRESGVSNAPLSSYSDSNYGGVVGFNWVLWDHLNVASHLLWVENPQPRVALLYRF